MGIVGRGGVGHTPCTAHICVTELVSETLEFICCEVIVIPQYMVVRGTTCTLRQRARGRGREGKGGEGRGREGEREKSVH